MTKKPGGLLLLSVLLVVFSIPAGGQYLSHPSTPSPVVDAAQSVSSPRSVGSPAVSSSATSYASVWTNLTNAFDTPPPLSTGASAYDPALGIFLLFGGGIVSGNGSSSILSNATWELSPTGTWTELHPANSPTARAGAAMVFLPPPASEFLLFGGANLTTPYSQTWTFNITTLNWTLVPTTIQPAARILPSLAQLPGTDEVYLFGGANATGNVGSLSSKEVYYSDLWSYSPSAGWTNVTPPTYPGGRVGAMFDYSGISSTLLLAGGIGELNKQTIEYLDTWTYSTTSGAWKELTNTSLGTSTFPTPTPALGCSYYNPINGYVDYIGGSGLVGSSNTTWEWSPVGGWQQILPADTPPGPVSGSACSWDSSLHGVILFGGLNLNVFGNPRFTDYESTSLVRYVGWNLSASSAGPIVAGVPFNLSASLAKGAGPEGGLNLNISLSDKGGSLTPKQISLVQGVGREMVTVWVPNPNDVVSACQWGVCTQLPLVVHAPSAGLRLSVPSTTKAGSPFNVSLQAVNATGSLTPWWNGTVTVGSNGVSGLTNVTVVNGTARTTLQIDRNGNYSVFAEAPGLSGALTSISVQASTLSNLRLTLSVGSVKEGGTVVLHIVATDAYGNPVGVAPLNLTDSLHDFPPQGVTVPSSGVLNVSLHIGSTSGNDTITATSSGVQGAVSLNVLSTVTGHPASPYSADLYLWVIAAAAAAIIALLAVWIVLRRRKAARVKSEREKKERSGPAAPAYLGFLPFKEEEESETDER